jgi:glycosyltransferase involved in cell wall biosynthesis
MSAAASAAAADVPSALEWNGSALRSIDPGPASGPLADGVTVVVCTYNRPASLERLLRSMQEAMPARLEVVIVDASHDDQSEVAIRQLAASGTLTTTLRYYRVAGRLRGLTRQKNFALRVARADTIVFFDDDVVLRPNCITMMEQVLREGAGSVAGVGAYLENEHEAPPALWRIRRALGIVSTLRPGAYSRSGMSVPWNFLTPGSGVAPGDWLPGGASIYPTSLAREIGFHEGFEGYSNGEDLQFSLAAGAHGRLVVARAARALHLQDPANRPNPSDMAYVSARNAHHIHRTRPGGCTRLDRLYFGYAFLADTVVRFLALARPGVRAERWQFLRGRTRFLADLLGGRLP